MPGNLMFADLSFPTIGEGESTKVSLQKVQNYLFLLLENLRYVLQNLEPGNFNEVEMEGYFKKLTADLVVADVVISNTIITNELYADYGSIADLTVDKLRTDYKKAANYLAGNKSPIDYISIHDEEISFLSATTNGTSSEQLVVNGRPFWWTDGTKTQMTGEENTGIPVMVYVYAELVKRSIQFSDENGTAIPVDSFGAGSGVTPTSGRGRLVKLMDSFEMSYTSSEGEKVAGVYLRDDGFADVTARRADITINKSASTITIAPEGAGQTDIVIDYVENGNQIAMTWPDGETFTVGVS